MSQPDFDVHRSADAVIRQRWCHPGERVLWIRNGDHAAFEVPGRSRRGKPLRQSGWRTAGRRALSLAEGVGSVLTFFSDDPGDTVDPPGVRVFGTRIDCRAAVFAEPFAWESTWVLTDRRFALVRLTGPHEVRTDAELATGRFAYHPGVKRKLRVFDCVAFDDGSVIDFLVRPAKR